MLSKEWTTNWKLRSMTRLKNTRILTLRLKSLWVNSRERSSVSNPWLASFRRSSKRCPTTSRTTANDLTTRSCRSNRRMMSWLRQTLICLKIFRPLRAGWTNLRIRPICRTRKFQTAKLKKILDCQNHLPIRQKIQLVKTLQFEKILPKANRQNHQIWIKITANSTLTGLALAVIFTKI